jgi:dienelactone hydrolase
MSNPAGNNYVTESWVTLPPFDVDRYEVTNRQFKEFVDAGGYENPEYWAALTEKLPFSETVKMLVDKTGRTGPSTWEIGTYATGEADFPVGGVSWYEAMAYAKFRDASLPTISHWAHSSLPLYASLLAPLSNFNSTKSEAVGAIDVAGPMGTYGTFGNVREWVFNSWGDRRWILGGGWSDPEYLSAFPFSLPPMDRSEINGLRLYHYNEPFPDEYSNPSIASFNDYQKIRPVSDDTYAVIKDQYIDVGESLVPEQISKTELEDWSHEIVRLNSDIAGEFFDLHIFLPKNANSKPQVVTYFPPISDFWVESDSHQIDLSRRFLPLDKIPRSGRALVWPVYYGSFERYSGIYQETPARHAQLQTELRVHWFSDLKRSLDYLETRSDMDSSKLAFLGYSYGASHALPLIALEERYDTAILVAGGLGNLGIDPMPQAADPINFISRIKIPVMMVNGKGDFVFPMETSQIPLFELLGTPDDEKKKVEYEGDHYQIPATAVTRDIVNWLDEKLGPP